MNQSTTSEFEPVTVGSSEPEVIASQTDFADQLSMSADDLTVKDSVNVHKSAAQRLKIFALIGVGLLVIAGLMVVLRISFNQVSPDDRQLAISQPSPSPLSIIEQRVNEYQRELTNADPLRNYLPFPVLSMTLNLETGLE